MEVFNPWNCTFNPNDDHSQRFGYDYEEVIIMLVYLRQLEYLQRCFFRNSFKVSASTQSHVRNGILNAAQLKGQGNEA